MPQETLEDKVSKSDKTNIWEFLVSAYSTNKTVKICLGLIGHGYSYLGTAIVSGIFYLSAKTLGIMTKYAAQFLTNPARCLKNLDLKDKISETIKFYNPFGKYRRSTFMGGTLSTVTYFTGF